MPYIKDLGPTSLHPREGLTTQVRSIVNAMPDHAEVEVVLAWIEDGHLLAEVEEAAEFGLMVPAYDTSKK